MQKKALLKKGFTLIELIVVFSIITVLSSIGIASLVSYDRVQEVNAAISDLQTMMQTARSRALSQVRNTCPANTSFSGYEVLICSSCSGLYASCVQCANTKIPQDDYELRFMCNGVATSTALDSKKLPAKVTINDKTTTNRAFIFRSLTGLTTGGVASISGYGKGKWVTVSATGVIQ
ncbi:MAG: pilus assembly FimT family protein [Candidatus Levyibacteriota bacterium]